MCVNPISDNINKNLILPTGRPPGPPCNNNDDVGENDYCETKNKSQNDYYSENHYSENDYYGHVPFNHHRYPDGQHGAMYMKPPLSPP